MRFLLLFIVCCCLPFIFLQAQETATALPDSSRRIVKDGYIEKMNHWIGVKLGVNNNVEIFEANIGSQVFELQPNISFTNRLSVNYGFLLLAFNFTPEPLARSRERELANKAKQATQGWGSIFTSITGITNWPSPEQKVTISITLKRLFRAGKKATRICSFPTKRM